MDTEVVVMIPSCQILFDDGTCMVLNAVSCHEEQILNCNMSDTEDGEMGANQEKDDVAMVEKLPLCNSLVTDQPGMHFTFLLVFF